MAPMMFCAADIWALVVAHMATISLAPAVFEQNKQQSINYKHLNRRYKDEKEIQ